jgi:uncharacterized protein (UPF0332 family)
MSEEFQEQRIEYRINQARETLKEAQALLDLSLYRGAINRAYYAMFYAILALTVLKGRVISKHSGVLSFFDTDAPQTAWSVRYPLIVVAVHS